MEAPRRIEVSAEALQVIWEDGSEDRIPAMALRASCPCAGCRSGRPPPPGEEVSIVSGRIVGDYAVGITFGPDGHATGIFPYPLLHSLAKTS